MSSIPERIVRQSSDPSLKVTVRIGKSGSTDAIVAELEDQLKTRELVKVKANRGIAGDSQEDRHLQFIGFGNEIKTSLSERERGSFLVR